MAAIIRIVALLALYCAVLQTLAEGHPLQPQCHIAVYKGMETSHMSLARRLQNLQHRRPSCHRGLLLKNFKNCDIKGKERLMLTLQRLSLVVTVLENMNKTDLVQQNLEVFSMFQTELRNCEKVKSPELKHCLHHLHQYRHTVTKECLENDVLLSLVWILMEDLGYFVYEEQSAKGMEKMVPSVTAKPATTTNDKDKRKKKSKKVENNDN